MSTPLPPASAEELLARAHAWAGASVDELAAAHGMRVPRSSAHAKGFVGTLLEVALGATAKSRAEPDFPALGIEMKSVPVDERGRPRESTYVCVAPMDDGLGHRWEESWVRHKLAKVLWVPILAGPTREVGARVIGSAVYWEPTVEEQAQLSADWEELAGLLRRGELWQLSARRGVALQVRPKAARASDLVWVVTEDGEWGRANPRGFYLRPGFVAGLLARAFPSVPAQQG